MLRILRRKNTGFTLIEILIVMVLIGILAVALLSAINPVEQIKKARDNQRKSDAAELLNAYDRYYTTQGCYPWDTACDGTGTRDTATNPNFAAGGDDEPLVADGEVKQQFANRDTLPDLWVSETASLVSVCFEPESESARTGGIGPLMQDGLNQTSGGTCGASYSGGGLSAPCFVCVPQ